MHRVSALATKRVPIWIPSAPSANAAAMPRPSTMPPAAINGTSTRSRIACSSTSVLDLLRVLETAALAALHHQPVHAGVNAFRARSPAWARRGTTTMPAALSGAMNLAGLPAEVVTKRMPDSQTKRSMASSLRKRIGRFTPNGRPLATIVR